MTLTVENMVSMRSDNKTKYLPALSPPARAALTTIQNLRNDRSPKTKTFQLQGDEDFLALQKHLRVDEELWQYLEDESRIDYSGRFHQLEIRNPSPQATSFINSLSDEVKNKIHCNAKGDSQQIFAASIYNDNNTTCTCNGSYGRYRWQHSPDGQYRYKSNVWPSVIIELAYGQREKELEDLAKDYISGSDGRVNVVVGIRVEKEGKRWRGQFSIWRTVWRYKENDKKMLSMECTHDEEYFCDLKGKPTGSGIPFNLSDFSLNSPKEIDVPFFLSSESLTSFIYDAEDWAAMEECYVNPVRKMSLPLFNFK